MKIIKTKLVPPSLNIFAVGCILSILLGVFFHFFYNLSGNAFLIGLFFPVNESIWEHLKLVLVPITIFALVYSLLIYKKQKHMLNNFWYYLSNCIIISMIIIPISHYTYKTIFKTVPDFVNILIYIISIIISFYYLYKKISMEYIYPSSKNKNSTGILTITILYLVFIIFTIYPPKLELFRDPITDTFGIYLL